MNLKLKIIYKFKKKKIKLKKYFNKGNKRLNKIKFYICNNNLIFKVKVKI